MKYTLTLLTALLFAPLAALHAADPLPAFPGAEGYGRFAKGGRGGDVYHVTNLNDSGEGSLRDAIKTKKTDTPRTIVFEVGGTIKLKKPLRIENVSGLTLAGQTAPGGGITVRDHGIDFRKCSDLIVRYMRFRLGDETKTSEDVINFGPEEGSCRDVMLDHVTATWGIDGIMDVYAADRFTMQWCLFGEALNDSTHYKKEPHAMLMSFRKIKGSISIHHNLLFSSRDRHPTLGGHLDFRNNVIYNWEGACNLGVGRFNLVANYWRPGPNTDFKRNPFPISPKIEESDAATGFLSGNVFESKPEWSADNNAAVQWGVRGGKYLGDVTREKFVQATEVVPENERPATQSAEEAYELVLAKAGASKSRDAADERVIVGIKERTHRRIDSQKEVGGWPKLESGTAPKDADRDGMTDEWETAHGLNQNDPEDCNATAKDGYTYLESYLNSLVP